MSNSTNLLSLEVEEQKLSSSYIYEVLDMPSASDVLFIKSCFSPIFVVGNTRLHLNESYNIPCNDLSLQHYVNRAALDDITDLSHAFNFMQTVDTGSYIRNFIGVPPATVQLFLKQLNDFKLTAPTLFNRAMLVDKQVWNQFLMLNRTYDLTMNFDQVILELSQRDRMFFSAFAGSLGTYAFPFELVPFDHLIGFTESCIGVWAGSREERRRATVAWMYGKIEALKAIMSFLPFRTCDNEPLTPYWMIHGWQTSGMPHIIFFHSAIDYVGALVFYLANNLRHHFSSFSNNFASPFVFPEWLTNFAFAGSITYAGGFLCSKHDFVDFATVDLRLSVALAAPLDKPASFYYELAFRAMFDENFTFSLDFDSTNRSKADQFVPNIPMKLPDVYPTVFSAPTGKRIIHDTTAFLDFNREYPSLSGFVESTVPMMSFDAKPMSDVNISVVPEVTIISNAPLPNSVNFKSGERKSEFLFKGPTQEQRQKTQNYVSRKNKADMNQAYKKDQKPDQRAHNYISQKNKNTLNRTYKEKERYNEYNRLRKPFENKDPPLNQQNNNKTATPVAKPPVY